MLVTCSSSIAPNQQEVHVLKNQSGRIRENSIPYPFTSSGKMQGQTMIGKRQLTLQERRKTLQSGQEMIGCFLTSEILDLFTTVM